MTKQCEYFTCSHLQRGETVSYCATYLCNLLSIAGAGVGGGSGSLLCGAILATTAGMVPL